MKPPSPSASAFTTDAVKPQSDSAGRAKFIGGSIWQSLVALRSDAGLALGMLKDEEWYAADVAYGGREMRKWSKVEYQSVGGEQVASMVRGLWDERGWECVWVSDTALYNHGAN